VSGVVGTVMGGCSSGKIWCRDEDTAGGSPPIMPIGIGAEAKSELKTDAIPKWDDNGKSVGSSGSDSSIGKIIK
jgi:hypothetical protein